MSAQYKLEVFDLYRIAAVARCDYRAVRHYVTGERKTRASLADAIDRALAALGYPPRAAYPQAPAAEGGAP